MITAGGRVLPPSKTSDPYRDGSAERRCFQSCSRPTFCIAPQALALSRGHTEPAACDPWELLPPERCSGDLGLWGGQGREMLTWGLCGFILGRLYLQALRGFEESAKGKRPCRAGAGKAENRSFRRMSPLSLACRPATPHFLVAQLLSPTAPGRGSPPRNGGQA